nr:MAG TPA: tail completion protein [Caudoviricetes sp.]
MVNDIIDGLSEALENSIQCKVYTRNVKQGLHIPCFFMQLLKPGKVPLIGARHIRDYPFDIQYFPTDESDNEYMMQIGDMLMDYLEIITLSDGQIVCGKDMEYEIVDGVLHFYVTYTVVLRKKEEEDSMRNYGLKTGVRNDR